MPRPYSREFEVSAVKLVSEQGYSIGDLDGAEAMHRKALEIDHRLGHLEGMAAAYGNLGNVLRSRSDPTGARGMWTKSRDLYAKLGNKQMVDRVQGWIDKLPP